jgi:hypothetical protein
VGRARDGRCYVVSKYIEGGDLRQRLQRRGRLGPEEAAELVRQVARALHHAHGQGLVHRDIKPANILLGQETLEVNSRLDVSAYARTGRDHPAGYERNQANLTSAARPDEAGVLGLELDQVYVADFGLALKTEDVQLAGQVAGTPDYMSPEQITGDVSRLDSRSDIFSLGVVLYELLVGKRPFRGTSLADLLTDISSGAPKPPDRWNCGVPETLSAICMKCLAKRPADRFQTGEQLADALQQWLTPKGRGQATVVSSPTVIPLSGAKAGKVVVSLIAVLLILSVLVYVGLRNGKLLGYPALLAVGVLVTLIFYVPLSLLRVANGQRLVISSDRLQIVRGSSAILAQVPYRNIKNMCTFMFGRNYFLGIDLANPCDQETFRTLGQQRDSIMYGYDFILADEYVEQPEAIRRRVMAYLNAAPGPQRPRSMALSGW